MKNKAILKYIKQTLGTQPDVLFAYIHGSALHSDNPQDIDIAVYLDPEGFGKLYRNGEVSIGFAIPMEMELEKYLGRKVDMQVLNNAPLSFRYRVISQGLLVIDSDSNIRCDFEYLSRVEYFDFRPRRMEYLNEVMT